MLRLHIDANPDLKAEEQRILSKIPMGRFAQPKDIVRGVRFFASDDAAYVTGAWLAVDGGPMSHG